MNILGVFHSYSDPSAALFQDGVLKSFIEEERLIRVKHATGYFPNKAVEYVLKANKLKITDVDCIIQAWDCNVYDEGKMEEIYREINKEYPTVDEDISYQRRHLNAFRSTNQKNIIYRNLKKFYGDINFPPVFFVNHHLSHACMAFFCSGFDESLVLTIDGRGEWTTTKWWIGRNGKLEVLKEVKIPHSLGWFYSAFTEYLGFEAYDGEYKVMGLAAYGKSNPELKEKISKLIWYDGEGGFKSDPLLLAIGERSFSYYYPDSLIKYLGRAPRSKNEEITEWHMDLAYEVQERLESIVNEMTSYWVKKTNIKNLAVAGGVGLNVKMNGNLFLSGMINDIFIHPLCADTGTSIGGPMAYLYENGKLSKSLLKEIYYGISFSDEEIENILRSCKLEYKREKDIERKAAELISKGKVVGWFQGSIEGGPRALGNRSILADPRTVESRDKVNAVIKFREFWRPFCPSMTLEGARRYLKKFTKNPFMIITFPVTDISKKEISAVVHVDDTSRPQIIESEENSKFYKLIKEFEKISNVPCVLNTSFNIKGEPIVCTPHDAIRTFSATGLDALAIGPFLIEKAHS